MLFFHFLVRESVPAAQIRKMMVLLTLMGFVGAGFPGFVAGLARQGAGWHRLSSAGFLFGLAGGAVLSAKVFQVESGFLLDRGVVVTALWLAIGRIGCAMAGCCFGKATDGPVGFLLPDVHGRLCSRYPSQLMASAVDFVLFAILFFLLRRRRGWEPGRGKLRGRLVWVFLGGYFIKRFFLDFLRGDLSPVLGPLTISQVMAVTYVLALLSLGIFRLSAKSSLRE